ncbi:MAG: hypothetical protein RLZZ360_63 [Candidatus Parcubacteria bacterium]
MVAGVGGGEFVVDTIEDYLVLAADFTPDGDGEFELTLLARWQGHIPQGADTRLREGTRADSDRGAYDTALPCSFDLVHKAGDSLARGDTEWNRDRCAFGCQFEDDAEFSHGFVWAVFDFGAAKAKFVACDASRKVLVDSLTLFGVD